MWVKFRERARVSLVTEPLTVPPVVQSSSARGRSSPHPSRVSPLAAVVESAFITVAEAAASTSSLGTIRLRLRSGGDSDGGGSQGFGDDDASASACGATRGGGGEGGSEEVATS